MNERQQNIAGSKETISDLLRKIFSTLELNPQSQKERAYSDTMQYLVHQGEDILDYQKKDIKKLNFISQNLQGVLNNITAGKSEPHLNAIAFYVIVKSMLDNAEGIGKGVKQKQLLDTIGKLSSNSNHKPHTDKLTLGHIEKIAAGYLLDFQPETAPKTIKIISTHSIQDLPILSLAPLKGRLHHPSGIFNMTAKRLATSQELKIMNSYIQGYNQLTRLMFIQDGNNLISVCLKINLQNKEKPQIDSQIYYNHDKTYPQAINDWLNNFRKKINGELTDNCIHFSSRLLECKPENNPHLLLHHAMLNFLSHHKPDNIAGVLKRHNRYLSDNSIALHVRHQQKIRLF